MFDKSFYPTPTSLIAKMVGKIKDNPNKILEPSAGKGDIIEYMKDQQYQYSHGDISAIEKNRELRAMLRGKNIKVIDEDFLAYSGPDKFDLIIANPPFDNGARHLLKAIEIMYRGQIIFLLNAETLRNINSNIRKQLMQKLEDLNADIEWIQDAFKTAERPTGVEVALINIIIERDIEDDLFTGVDDKASKASETVEDVYEVSTGKNIPELVTQYNRLIKIGTDTIVSYYQNYKEISGYISLHIGEDKCRYADDMTGKMQSHLNSLLEKARYNYWRRVLELNVVRKRMTADKYKKFEHLMNQRCDMDFTENNIRSFILNLIDGYENTLTEAVIEIFDLFTRHGYRDDDIREKNTHLFNGWKTNNAFKVCKKVIVPIYCNSGFGGPFRNFGRWNLDYQAAAIFRDIDIVMNYFDGMRGYTSIEDAINEAFDNFQSTKIKSTYFTITCYKKGTAHLIFNNADILRRFNVAACKGKGWLPPDYGYKTYKELDCKSKDTIDSFEGAKSYKKNFNQPLFADTIVPQLTQPILTATQK